MRKFWGIILWILIPVLPGLDAQKALQYFPEQALPEQTGKKVAEHFLLSPHGVYGSGSVPHIPYFEVCTWYGSLRFAKESRDTALRRKLVERYQPLFDREKNLLPVPDHVDYTVFGALPLEIFLQTGEQQYFETGKLYADTQWGKPEGPRVVPASYRYYENGYSWQTRLWIDDMYMITLLQAAAYRATGNKIYIDRAAKEMVLYLDSLQKSNGLFYHAPGSPFFWGRGNGWMAAGMTELLLALPADNPYRPRIMKGFRLMMKSLYAYQATDGMWRQLIDDPESWKESSATGMFAFAMITGVKNGWLPKKQFGNAARKAWLALNTYINDKGDVREICEGTGAGFTRDYYLARKRLTGDFHGQAPVLWCSAALLKK